MSLLTLSKVVASYGDHLSAAPVLSGLTLRLESGEILGVSGASGSGKSTLLRLIAGELSPSAGHVLRTWTQGSVAYSPQEDVLIGFRTGWENACLLLERSRPGSGEAPSYRFLNKAIDELSLSTRMNASPAALSGGMRQRIQVLQTLAPERELLLLDEPFSEQDRDHQVRLEQLILTTLRSRRASAVIVSHDMGGLAAVCDRVIFLGGQPSGLLAEVEVPGALRDGRPDRRSAPTFASTELTLWSARAEAARTT